jgi:hypothetical protein
VDCHSIWSAWWQHIVTRLKSEDAQTAEVCREVSTTLTHTAAAHSIAYIGPAPSWDHTSISLQWAQSAELFCIAFSVWTRGQEPPQ